MFTALVITRDRSLGEGLERLAVASGQVSVSRSVDHYPTPFELVQALNACDPELVFLDISDWELARPVAESVREKAPKAAVVGFGGGWIEGRGDSFAKAGVSTLLTSPVTLKELQDGVARAVRSVRGTVLKNVLAFLPAKAGSGCSLTALNVAARLAENYGKKVLLIEVDLHSGVLEMRLRLEAGFYLQDVLENPTLLSRSEWAKFIVEKHGVEFLPADGERRTKAQQWNNYFHMIEFVAREYDTVVVDLPEVVNEATAELVRRAGSTILVTTTEPAALELGQRRLEDLESRGVDPLRVSIVVNRCVETPIELAVIEEMLEHSIRTTLPLDTEGMDEAVRESKPVSPDTDLGFGYTRLAAYAIGAPPPAAPPPPRKGKFRIASIIGR